MSVEGLGNKRGGHLLSPRVRSWAAPVPDNGSQFPEHHRQRSSTTSPEARRQASEGGSCLCRRREQFNRHFPFLPQRPRSRPYGVEAGGQGMSPGKHAAPLVAGREGVLHGMMTYVLQNAEGQIDATQSISAGLDYPAVGPEHSYLMSMGAQGTLHKRLGGPWTPSNSSRNWRNNASVGARSRDNYATHLAKKLGREESIIRKPVRSRRQGRGHDCKTASSVTTRLTEIPGPG